MIFLQLGGLLKYCFALYTVAVGGISLYASHNIQVILILASKKVYKSNTII